MAASSPAAAPTASSWRVARAAITVDLGRYWLNGLTLSDPPSTISVMSEEQSTEREPKVEIKVAVKSLMLDPSSSVPIVILQEEEESQRILPIWIGIFEASAIAARIDGQEPQRPLTHDLLLQGLQTVGAEVEKVVICDLQESTFFAKIHLQSDATALTLDARPSDAIALALRAEVPVFVFESVFQKAQAAETVTQETDEERIKKWLEEVSPEELGKYTM